MISKSNRIWKMDIAKALSDVKKWKNDIPSDLYNLLKLKWLLKKDEEYILSEKWVEIVSSVKSKLNDIYISNDYNIDNWSLLSICIHVEREIEKIISDFIWVESKDFVELNYETPVSCVVFHEDKRINNSIIISLIQSHVRTLKDLINLDLRLYWYVNSKEAVNAIEKVILLIENTL